MGVFRRHEPSGTERNIRSRFTIPAKSDDVDAPELVREPCWFCGDEVEYDANNPTGAAAEVLIQPIGPGEPLRGVCHRACADRGKGSLSTSGAAPSSDSAVEAP
jgi:hypothetical protein